ncbi:3074_t:CDS:10 [Funneliformis geosporum]|uniref:1331_t:CDS:1 n=1 Tax=Funneliformis geosporum TaxID=1117311 RepID=A0A9W4SFM7_9GLOM|nr:3074_t:CDS:10 [Funneliformis geosporum]CAI2165370.1 1331_t:CDS:10 [Funneliformis geosporum]
MGQVMSIPTEVSSKSLSSSKKRSVLLVGGVVAVYLIKQYVEQERKKQVSKAANGQDNRNRKHKRIGVDSRFVSQIKKLLPICIPGIASKEATLLVALAMVLIARTWLDIWFSGFNGHVVKAIVSRDRKTFIARAVVEFGFMMWPMSVVNNSLKLTISALALSFRTRLTKYANEQYLKDITFYKISNIDNRIQNADQLLTQDIDKFAENLSHLYSDIAKPIVDMVLFAYKLGEAIGREAPIYMIAYFMVSGALLRAISPPFGKYTAIEQKLEGDFRFTHSRIITHSEEIAFYGGGEREKAVVNGSFDKIVRHVKKIYRLRFANGIFDSVLVKYCATMTAYYLLARPVFDPKYATEFMGKLDADPTKIMEDYSRNSGYLVNLSQAVGRLILAGRDLTRFAGYTSRVAELFDVLDDVNKGRYERTMVSKDSNEANVNQAVTPNDLKGKIITKDGVIYFDKVPIVTPNNDVLVKELSFKVEKGMNCLISGPNGCGKSSLFRILGNLWPLFDGTVTKPAASKLFYVPQKPYLALGTFRDQIIYPDTKSQARSKGFDDNKLLELLNVVHLEYLVDRDGGWDAVQDWADVLSGGEKQRVAMARLFYHRPQFAILDECTSAVSVDVEGIMYTHAHTLGITLFTVSHRHSLLNIMSGFFALMEKEIMNFGSKLEEGDLTTPFAFSHGKSNKKKFEVGQGDEGDDDEGEEADNEKNSSSSSNNSD